MELTATDVSPSFPATMGISIIGGRDFREDDLNSSKDLCIFNRTAGDLYGISPGDIGNSLEVIGISDDIRFASFRKEVTPTALVLNRNNRFSYAVIRVKAGSGLKPVRAEIEKFLKNSVRNMNSKSISMIKCLNTHTGESRGPESSCRCSV